MQLDFRGSAKVDNFSIYENGVQRVFEDFKTTGQTTAQLMTSTGYLISTGLTGSTVTTWLYIGVDPSLFFIGYGKLTDDGYVEELIQSQQNWQNLMV